MAEPKPKEKKWKCGVCGYVFYLEGKPVFCKVCGATIDKLYPQQFD